MYDNHAEHTIMLWMKGRVSTVNTGSVYTNHYILWG